jgi:hypothetical protein
MSKTQPYIQKFFYLNQNLFIDDLLEMTKTISKSYFDNQHPKMSLSTKDETSIDLNFDEMKTMFHSTAYENIDMISISINGVTLGHFQLVIQISNENVGSNGNYTIMLNDKQINTNIEEIIQSKLSLTSKNYKMNFKKLKSDIEVNPIFNKRDFQYKEDQCFVLMPFTEAWSERLIKQIKTTVINNNFSCKRADDLFGSNILEDIWTAINESAFIIADITNKNPNVFYEIGIAHTLGKKVILLTQEVNDIPSDFKIYRHIIYEDNIDGFERLERMLKNFICEIS